MRFVQYRQSVSAATIAEPEPSIQSDSLIGSADTSKNRANKKKSCYRDFITEVYKHAFPVLHLTVQR